MRSGFKPSASAIFATPAHCGHGHHGALAYTAVARARISHSIGLRVFINSNH